MFSSVPREVKLHLMSFLRKNDLRNISQVSKELNELCDVLDKERSSETLTVLKKYSPSLASRVEKKDITLEDAASHCLNLFDPIRKNLMKNEIKICFCGVGYSSYDYPITLLHNSYFIEKTNNGSYIKIDGRNLFIFTEGQREYGTQNPDLWPLIRSGLKNKLEGRIAIILSDNVITIHGAIKHFTKDCEIIGLPCPFMLIISNTPVDLNSINYPSPCDFTLAKELSSNSEVLTAIHSKINEENGYLDQINLLQLVCQKSKPENSNSVCMRMK